jgi:hypothetical protein
LGLLEAQTSPKGIPVATSELVSEIVVSSAEVDGSRSTSSWSVAGGGWKQLLPDLPDDVIAMLATPVVVTAEALTAPRQKPVKSIAATTTEVTPRFLAPAPPKRVRPRQRFA